MTTFESIGVLFLLLCVSLYLAFYLLLKEGLQKSTIEPKERNKAVLAFLVIIPLWWFLVFLLEEQGFFLNISQLPPRPALFALLPLPFVLWFSRSKVFEALALSITPALFVYLQVFRLFVELILWAMALERLLPDMMTFEGENFDILIGIGAPFIGFFFFRKNVQLSFFYIWNVFGLILLLNVVMHAILSFPTPLQVLNPNPGLDLITTWPVLLLPTFLVPCAYIFHILSIRQGQILRKHDLL